MKPVTNQKEVDALISIRSLLEKAQEEKGGSLEDGPKKPGA